MPKAMKKVADDENEDLGILAQLGVPDPSRKSAKVAKAAADADSAALLARIGALESDRDELRRTNATLLNQAPRAAATEAPDFRKASKLDLKGLPDPAVDPEAYNTALAERISASVAAGIEADRAARAQEDESRSSQREQVDGLWADFAKDHPELADHQDVIEFAATKAIEAAQKRGVDLNRYMFGTREQFFKDVAAIGGKLVPAQAADGDETDLTTLEKDENDDAGRTAGIFGGITEGGKPAKGKDKPGDMIKDIQDIQRASGFY